MTSVFHQLLQTESFVDVTLSCNDSSLKAHKVVLSACSSYFQKLLIQNPCNHPTIIMPPDVPFNDLKIIIDFVYRGEIDVDQTQLQSLLKTADQLKIKGLCEVSDSGCPGSDADNSSSDFKTPINLFSPDYQTDENTKNYNYGNVPHSTRATDSQNHHIKRQATKRKNSPLTSTQGGGRSSPLPKKGASLLKKPVLKDRAVQSDPTLDDSGMNVPENGLDQNSAVHSQNAVTGSISDPVRHEPQIQSNGERVPECITVSTSTEDDEKNVPVVILERSVGTVPMIVHNMQTSLSPQMVVEGGNSNTSVQGAVDNTPPDVDIPPEAQPAAPSATLVENLDLTEHHQVETIEPDEEETEHVKVKFETLRSVDQSGDAMDMDHLDRNQDESESMHTMMITPELLGLFPTSSGNSVGRKYYDLDGGETEIKGNKAWTHDDMELALDALRNHNMSLTKASSTYGIPSTTLWQRAHRLGIDTPKKEGNAKNWTEDNLNSALEALRTGTISANKASKAYGIPSSTLYKIARREGIRLAAPFNAAPTTWTQEDLDRALESIRSGQASVQRASAEYGIPTGTLYGRCKREGIELSRSNPTPWSEDAMGEALEAVRVGQMSINQAAIHYNLPYSSLYGRFKRGKYEAEDGNSNNGDPTGNQMMMVNYPPEMHPFQSGS
ncbi:hypothetical protein RUM43_001744 [Polyplax serrata]|uniref:Pipsqueak n=1 Tax=Polyplax serrata TaxID=468196 RepID=A0AAN8SET3_POLSC